MWINPKLDWQGGDGIQEADLNRIEGNINYLYRQLFVSESRFIERYGWVDTASDSASDVYEAKGAGSIAQKTFFLRPNESLYLTYYYLTMPAGGNTTGYSPYYVSVPVVGNKIAGENMDFSDNPQLIRKNQTNEIQVFSVGGNITLPKDYNGGTVRGDVSLAWGYFIS